LQKDSTKGKVSQDSGVAALVDPVGCTVRNRSPSQVRYKEYDCRVSQDIDEERSDFVLVLQIMSMRPKDCGPVVQPNMRTALEPGQIGASYEKVNQ